MTQVTTSATYKTLITADLPDFGSRDITFRLVAAFFNAAGEEVIDGTTYTMTLDASGVDDGSFYLPTPDNTGVAGANWFITLPSGFEDIVTVAYSGTEQAVSDLLASGSTTTDPDVIVAAIAGKANKVSGATADNLASLTSGGDLADSGAAAANVPTGDEKSWLTAGEAGGALGTAAYAATGDFDVAGSAAAAIASLGGADGTVSDEQLRNWAGQLPGLMTSVTRTDYSKSWTGLDGRTQYAGWIKVTGTVTWPDGVTGHLDGVEYPEEPGALQYFTVSHVAGGKIVVQSPMAAGAAGITVITPDYYVDSAAGAGGDGSLATPFDAISDLGTLSAGAIVALKSGSEWREQLSIAANNIAIYRYGAGDKPLLRGDDVVPNASFTKSGGYTNLYQVTITTNYIASEPGFVGAWEDDTRLTHATSAANCDATPGTYWVANHNAVSITVYVHATGSGDVTANGKVYEMTTRLGGVFANYASQVSGMVVDGIHASRGFGQAGSLKAGKTSIIRHCDSSDGGKHNLYVRTGSSVYGCDLNDGYYNLQISTFVFNEDSPASEGVSVYDSVARYAAYNALAIAWYGHYNVGGSYGALLFSRCVAQNCAVGFTTGNVGTSSFLYSQCDTSSCKQGYTSSNGAEFVREAVSCYHSNQAGGSDFVIGNIVANTRWNIKNCYFSLNLSANLTGSIYYQYSGTLVVENTRLYGTAAGSGSNAIVGAAGAAVVLQSVKNYVSVQNKMYYLPNAGSTVNSNLNVITNASSGYQLGASSYASVAAWQAAGKDTLSVVALL